VAEARTEPPLRERGWWPRVYGWCVAVYGRRTGSLPAGLRGLPPVFWVAALGVMTLLVVGLTLSALSGGKRGEASTPRSASTEVTPILRRWLPPPTAPAETLAAAVASGGPALDDLATKYPGDPAVWRAVMRAATKDKRGVDAMRALAKLVALEEGALQEDDSREALTAAAAGPSDASNAAFTLMESGLGSRGPDAMFDLLAQKGTPARVTQRLKLALAKPETRALMSKALALTLDFRNASGCDAKKALIPRVKEQGDGRLLPTLRSMQSPKGCGFLGLSDCWGCMRRDGALGSALAAVEERSAK
jgi:hypothetical protein